MRTVLCERLNIRVPVFNAPMTPMAGGALAGAVSQSGAMGMYGIGSSDAPERIAEQRALIGDAPFGVGLVAWVLERRPELLDLALDLKPTLIALSFGDVAPYVDRVHRAGVLVAVQVQDRAKAIAAERAGADIIVAQGTEAGGHTGAVGTLPLLQLVLDAVEVPVVAAGGIATGRGLAAVLAAGACGAWIGTPFLLATEALTTAAARAHVVASDERSTILTDVFDVATQTAWPREFKGRAIVNTFARQWEGRRDALAEDPAALRAFAEARVREDYAIAHVYAGQSVAYADRTRPAAEIVREIADDAQRRIAALCSDV